MKLLITVGLFGVALGGSLRENVLQAATSEPVDPLEGELFGGDMMMTKEEIEATYGHNTAEEAEKAGHTEHGDGGDGNGRRLGVATGRRWPNGKVCYYWHRSATSTTKARALEAMRDIARYTPISFTLSTTACSGYKVEIGKSFGTQGGCWAHIGAGTNHRLQLDNGCETKGIAIHEFLHSLGLHHEQTAPDRDKYVTINLGNVKTSPVDYRSNFYKATLLRDVGNSYDYESIMHYGEKAFSKNGGKTIDCRGWACGQRGGLSWGDIYNIRRMYQTYKDTLKLVPVRETGIVTSGSFSEENGGYSMRGTYPAKGLTCSGRYCDNMRIRYVSGDAKVSHAMNWWSRWFSEENSGNAMCPSGMVITQIQCKGSYCDDIRFRCDRLAKGYVRSNDISGTVNWFSEEENTRECSAGQAMVGIRCRGRYCDGKYLYCASIYKKSGSGVSLYRDVNYVGDSSHFKEGRIPNMGNMAVGNDHLSSISIDACYKITIYEHSNYQGRSQTFTQSVSNLHATGWGDKTSSFVIARDSRLCTQTPPPSPTPARQWGTDRSRRFSEENKFSGRGTYPARGIQCYGSYCDDMVLLYGRGEVRVSHNSNWWSHWFSEENSGNAMCPSGKVISEIQCSGRYCDNLRIRCDNLATGYSRGSSVSSTVGWVSEEQSARACAYGQALIGIRCSGRYCDNKLLYCAKLYKN